MPARNPDLHGSAPDKCETALLLIDVINDFDFPEAKQLLKHALPMAERLFRLKRRVKDAGVPVIYVNDNFGRWQSDWRRQIQHCMRPEALGREMVSLLQPEEDDYFVLKPKHSGFFSTTLETLLRYLGSKTLILTGVAGNFCVLFTANDAYMRDYALIVPADCTASNSITENNDALGLMRKFLKADTRKSVSIKLERGKRKRAPAAGKTSRRGRRKPA